MCACGKPTINGVDEYSWDGESRFIRNVDPPALNEDDMLIFDLPGRCGAIDAHSHHFRVVIQRKAVVLLVRHGGGDERIPMPDYAGVVIDSLGSMSESNQYWFVYSIYSAVRHESRGVEIELNAKWRQAFVDKRIKKRKSKGMYSVWIEQPETATANGGEQ
jgi:hypothetical protein